MAQSGSVTRRIVRSSPPLQKLTRVMPIMMEKAHITCCPGTPPRVSLPHKFGTISQSVFIKASPEAVYKALVDARKHTEFTGSPATTSNVVGAEFTAWDGYISGKNLELVRGKKIVQEWKTTEWPEGYPPSILRLTLIPRAGGTQLRMLHSKVPADQVERYKDGWHSSYWDPLKKYFQRLSRAKSR